MINRILIVDDDATFRSEFKEYFEEYGVSEAPSGEEALKILGKPNEIDLVILDVRMSGMSGIEVLSRIRKLIPNVRIIILTGYSSKDVAVEALRGQADDYIEKPLDIDATKKIIEKFMGTKRGQPNMDAIDMKEKIERVKNFLQRNALKKVSLNDAAQTVYLSPKYLSRVFKEYVGMGFHDYKSKLKIEEAKELLIKTGYNINQITEKLGYANPESFIRQFEKVIKLTPTGFRNKIKTKSKKRKK
ncbi:MAG: response regulator [Candidatus Omnitrophica bacterium]|nr:response regulator [Candidatus Omnitrophota bacterium]